MNKIEKIFYEELSKYKTSETERECVIEDFEYEEECFIKEEGSKASGKKIRDFVKEFLKEHVHELKEDEDTHERVSVKQAKKIDCILDVLRNERMHLSVKDMSELLSRHNLSKGASYQNLYKWIPKELQEYSYIEQDSEGKYFYNRPSAEQNRINQVIENRELVEAEKKEQITIISSFLDSIKDSPVYEKAKEFFSKEEKKLRSFMYKNTNSANYSRILFMGAPEANIKKETWGKIYNAMATNSVMQIEYTPVGKTKSESYKIAPYQLIFDNGLWDLWAYSYKNKEMRLFNLSRITSAHILAMAGNFILPKGYSFMNSVTGNFGCYNDKNPQVYKIKFDKKSYAWTYSKDRIWGKNQTVEETDDGYILSFEASQYLPILRWVLGWGEEVTPLDPPKLVEDWKQRIEKMKDRAT